ncbi:DUF1211 domain-containing protein [Natronosporangium hydrolyticum]|uniref:DUF1211 domain-containing protein n=1 Tax=Natronosporangium hydrolyticum TaxID=2811111 RepID=A0A895YBF8_9ACTN|nr:TMEM175 family protein [Natronosporangium hydrolyticum]QSB12659.1 DUF1211 domain-containing protein [Natronosporangium hydrolyticum]
MDSRPLDRTTAFTDAAVAIALTLLVLPLVEVVHSAPQTPLPELVDGHGDDLLAFVVSFFVVMTFWRAHRRLFEPVQRLDERLLTLNGLWLLGVVFLPVPTAVLTFEAGDPTGAAVFYLGNLLYVALANLALAAWVYHRRSLWSPEHTGVLRQYRHRALAAVAVIAVATVLAVPFGGYALLTLAVVPAVQYLQRRRRTR